MNDYQSYAHFLLHRSDLESKCTKFEDFLQLDYRPSSSILVEKPARDDRIKFSNDQIKFPKKGALKADPKLRGLALHFFANHELLAIEMMAQAILKYPNLNDNELRVLISTIEDEIKHLKLYISRMNDFGVEFGDYPLNDFFWSYMKSLDSAEKFYCVMALTFEQANLDFSNYYREIFQNIGDTKTASIMNVIYEDEISHVARGYSYIKKKIEDPKKTWDFYTSQLPDSLGPERAKGMIFDDAARARCGLNQDYISSLKNYKSDFRITKRKQWS